MSSPRRLLAVLSFPNTVTVTDAIGCLDRLEGAGAIEIDNAVLIERGNDGALHVSGLDERLGKDFDVAALTALTWFVEEMLDCPEDGLEVEGSPRSQAFPGICESFVTELREVLPAAALCIALVAPRVDAGAALDQLRRLPQVRLVYGALPERALTRVEDLRPVSSTTRR